MNQKPKDWEIEFEKIWREFEMENAYEFPEIKSKLKQFISDLLQEEKQNIVISESDKWYNILFSR